jgi:hypothetical protein
VLTSDCKQKVVLNLLQEVAAENNLEVDWLIVGAHAGLLEGLTQSRVGMASPGQVLRTGSVFNGNNGLGNHFSGVCSDDVATNNLVRVLFRQNLDKSL